MRFLGQLGGGLGDVFRVLYHHSEYQILPLIKNAIIVDLVVECCNPAVKSVLGSMIKENGDPVFRDIIYRDLFFSTTEEGKELADAFRAKGYHFIRDEAGWRTLFDASCVENPYQYGYFHGKVYRHKYNITYQEREFLNWLHFMPYIVIHPSGGLQSVDGLTRDEYAALVSLLLAEFPYMRVVAIGASHTRVWADKQYDCEGCKNLATIHKQCLRRTDKLCIRYEEKPVPVEHENFIDLTNRTSGALCANIVDGAAAFVGCHSAWINMFWNFNKPSVCIISDRIQWGSPGVYISGEEYIEANGCSWGFGLAHNRTLIARDNEGIYKVVVEDLKELGI